MMRSRSFTSSRMPPAEPMTLPEVKCYNPAFDVTDHELLTAIVTDRGVVYPPFEQNLKKLFEE